MGNKTLKLMEIHKKGRIQIKILPVLLKIAPRTISMNGRNNNYSFII